MRLKGFDLETLFQSVMFPYLLFITMPHIMHYALLQCISTMGCFGLDTTFACSVSLLQTFT